MRGLQLLAAAAACAAYVPEPWSYNQTEPAVTVTVNAHTRYQTMIGGGCSGAFGIACQQLGSAGLSAAKQAEVTRTLFDENVGGLSILRNGIGSSENDDGGRMGSILPVCPPTPAGPFHYVWPKNASQANTCQLELTKQAKKVNPDLYVYADAWSAPGCFKSVGTDNNGGFICGVRGATNCTHDWRQAYADYLVQYARYYHEAGIDIDLIGAWNEPDFNPVTYASMESDGWQAKDFLEVFYPTLKKAFPKMAVACCDGTGARQERNLLDQVERAGGSALFDVATWHNYQSNAERPFNVPAGRPNIMTEWADGGGSFNTTWDVTGQLAEGLQWSMYIHNAVVNGMASGWTHWWCAGAGGGDGWLIDLEGDSFSVSRRLWAFAGFFRFARPGAVRIAADSSVEDLYVSAFVNKNGSVAVPVINAGHFKYDVSLDLIGLNLTKATAYLTDNSHNVTAVAQHAISGGKLILEVEPRSMKTFFLE